MRTIHPVTHCLGTELFEYTLEYKLIESTEDLYKYKYLNSDLIVANFAKYTDKEL